MHVAAETAQSRTVPQTAPAEDTQRQAAYAQYRVIRRNGSVVGFEAGEKSPLR